MDCPNVRCQILDFDKLVKEDVVIDIAKEKHHAFFGTPKGKTLFKRLVFENSIEGF